MQGNDGIFTVLYVFVQILDLLRVHVRHRVFHRRGQIDDRLAIRRRLPDVKHGVHDFERVFRLRTGEAFGRIFEAVVFPRLLRQPL